MWLKKKIIFYLLNKKNKKLRVKKDSRWYRKGLCEDRWYYSVCCYRLYINACVFFFKQKALVIRIKQKHKVSLNKILTKNIKKIKIKKW